MITQADLLAAFPDAKNYPEAAMATWINVANAGMPDSRFKRDPDHGRLLFVMHHLSKPRVRPAAPTVTPPRPSRRGRAGPATPVKRPHIWDTTPHGKRLIAATKY